MNLSKIDEAAISAWPALEEYQVCGGVLRCANGVSRRSNCLVLSPAVQCDIDSLLTETESFFMARGLPPIVRMLTVESLQNLSFPASLQDTEIDQMLASRGYEREGETIVMTCGLPLAHAGDYVKRTTMSEVSLPVWLDCWFEFTGRDRATRHTHLKMLQKNVSASKFYLLRNISGDAVSCSMLSTNGQLAGLFGIATHPQARGEGYAQTLIHKLLNTAAGLDLDFAYLQVEADNTAALRLYQKLGFEPQYSYWYRVRPVCKEWLISNSNKNQDRPNGYY